MTPTQLTKLMKKHKLTQAALARGINEEILNPIGAPSISPDVIRNVLRGRYKVQWYMIKYFENKR